MCAEFVNGTVGPPPEAGVGSNSVRSAPALTESESFEQALDVVLVDDAESEESHWKDFDRTNKNEKSLIDERKRDDESGEQQQQDPDAEQEEQQQNKEKSKKLEAAKQEKDNQNFTNELTDGQSDPDGEAQEEKAASRKAADDNEPPAASDSESSLDDENEREDEDASSILQGGELAAQRQGSLDAVVVSELRDTGSGAQPIPLQHPAPTTGIPFMGRLRRDANNLGLAEGGGSAKPEAGRYRWITYVAGVVLAFAFIFGGVFFYYWYQLQQQEAVDDPLSQYDQELERLGDGLTEEQKLLLAQSLDQHLADILNQVTVLVVSNQAVIGLRYVAKETPLPMILLKEKGRQAAMVLAVAEQRGIPIFQNNNLVGILWEKSRVNGFIPPETLQDIARITARASRLLKVY